MLKDEPSDINDRLRALMIDRQTLLNVLRGRVTLDLDLPDDAAVREVNYDFYSRGFVLIIWSYAFGPVPEGCEIPRLQPFMMNVKEPVVGEEP